MTDGWKFAESLLGVTAEALKARREAEAQMSSVVREEITQAAEVSVAADLNLIFLQTGHPQQESIGACLATVRKIAKGTAPSAEDPHEHHRRMWVLHGEKKAPEVPCPLRECILPDGHMDRPPHLFHRKANGDTFPTPEFTDHETQKRGIRTEVADRLNAAMCPDPSQRTNLPFESALSEAERRLTGYPAGSAVALLALKARQAAETEIAASIAAILSPGTPPQKGWNLAMALEGVENLRHWTRETERKVRDSALEEAENAIRHADRKDRRDLYPDREQYEANICGWTSGANAALDAIRAQKSKPAPTPAWRSGYDPSAPVVIGQEGTGSAPQPSGNSGELPLHDFGWALQQMRAGKKVKRKSWGEVIPPLKLDAYGSIREPDDYPVDALKTESVVATDWQVVE